MCRRIEQACRWYSRRRRCRAVLGAIIWRADGFRVTVLDRDPAKRERLLLRQCRLMVAQPLCAAGRAGMVALGLQVHVESESPFYLKPRLSARLSAGDGNSGARARKRKVERCRARAARFEPGQPRRYYEQLGRELMRMSLGSKKMALLLLCNTAARLCTRKRTLPEHGQPTGFARPKCSTPAETAEPRSQRAMNIVGSVFYSLRLPSDAGPARSKPCRRLCISAAFRFVWNTQVDRLQAAKIERSSPFEAAGRKWKRTNSCSPPAVWSDDMLRQIGLENSDAGGQRLQPDAPQSAAAAADAVDSGRRPASPSRRWAIRCVSAARWNWPASK